MFTNTNLQPKRIYKYMCDVSIHTVPCIFFACGFENGCVGYAHAHLAI